MEKVKCEIYIECKNKETANLINKALSIDNERYIKTEVRENYIIAKAEAENIMSLLHTLDDFLSCLSLAMKIV